MSQTVIFAMSSLSPEASKNIMTFLKAVNDLLFTDTVFGNLIIPRHICRCDKGYERMKSLV